MKFIITNILVLITSVSFLIYLLNSSTFLPYDSLGDPNFINIFVFVSLLFVIVFTFLILIICLILFFLKKELTRRQRFFISFKYSLIISLGLLSVGVLNFFNVLDWMWGLSVLGVVLFGLIII